MAYNYPLKYRTLDQLISSVAVDFYKNQLEGTINPQELIKIVKKVNYDLGLRIMMTKEEVLEVEKGRVKLPDNFYVLNYALVCDEIGTYQQMPQGTHLEDIKVFPQYQETNTVIDLCTPEVINCNTTVEGCTCSCSISCNGSCGCTCNNCQNPAFNKICETPVVETNEVNTSNTNTNTTTNTVTDTIAITQCSWYFAENQSNYWFSIIINEQLYNLSPSIGGIDAAIIVANLLGLGTFNYVIVDGNIILIVTGTQEYSTLYIDNHFNPPLGYEASCTQVGQNTVVTTTVDNTITVTDTTDTTVNTTTNCCAVSPDPCTKPRVVLNCKGEVWEVVQVVNPGVVNYFTRLTPLRLKQNAESIDCDCPNLYMQSTMQGWIQNGFLFTNFDCGKVYINYQGTLEDDDGNLLVPDHDGLNDYYEYSLKKRILENLMMNDEPVGQKLQYVIAELKTARLFAKTIVNTPNFSEMKELWMMNRRAQYGKYFDMFKSYTWHQWDRNPNMDMLQNPGR